MNFHKGSKQHAARIKFPLLSIISRLNLESTILGANLTKTLLSDLAHTAKAATQYGLKINAGHDLTDQNLPDLVQAIPNLSEVSIGHALNASALLHGYKNAVYLYRSALGHEVNPT